MKFKKTTHFVFLTLLAGLWLLVSDSPAQAVRVAGEEGVTPTAPQARPKADQPAPVKHPPRTRAQARPAAVKGKTVPEGAIPEGEAAPETPQSENRYVTIDFDGVDITLFIKFISELTGKNFVVDKGVKGEVTIISPAKITVEEAYRVFESVLEVNGYTTVPAGKIMKIVPAVAARGKDIETKLREEAITAEDKVITQLIPLRYADCDELTKLFAPLISKSSVIVSYPPTRMLIVTDVQSNIKRLLSIIEAVDVPGIGEEISVVPLRYATASVMAKSLNEVFQEKTATAKRTTSAAPVLKIVPDDRTNVLILLASEDDTTKIMQLVALLDKETPRGEGDIHVYYLQNANAEDLAEVLKAIPAQEAKAAQKGAAPVISKEIQIVPDKATNSLVITSNKDDFLVLEDVIKKLDIPRRMVYIEAILMEVSLTKNFDLGVQWEFAEAVGSHEGRDVAAFGASLAGETLTPLGTGFSLGILGDTISIGGVEFTSIAAVIKAVETDSDVHILSTPQIMTTDNEEAEIVAAKNVPFQTRVETTSETTGREYTSYEYRDVGVTLNITPQISQKRFVRLKISEEVSQVIEEESEAGLPTTLKRVAKTTVIVQDGHTVVIGGLIDKTMSEGTTQTPCLGGIPGVGWLFKAVRKDEDRTNLYFFLTPHIVENAQEARKLYKEKKEEIDGIKAGVVKLYEGRGKKTKDMRYSDLGYQLLKAKDYDKAKQYFEKALQINPDNPYALLNMGVIYEAEGKRDEAIKMYEKVITLNPEGMAFESVGPEKIGRKLVEIAGDSVRRLKDEGKEVEISE